MRPTLFAFIARSFQPTAHRNVHHTYIRTRTRLLTRRRAPRPRHAGPPRLRTCKPNMLIFHLVTFLFHFFEAHPDSATMPPKSSARPDKVALNYSPGRSTYQPTPCLLFRGPCSLLSLSHSLPLSVLRFLPLPYLHPIIVKHCIYFDTDQ